MISAILFFIRPIFENNIKHKIMKRNKAKVINNIIFDSVIILFIID